MADQKHVAILARGRSDWNAWRRSQRFIGRDGGHGGEPDLSGANFKHANLHRCDFAGVNFSGANLCSANLNWADLREANLSGVRMNYANLVEAQLGKANLRDAQLRGASLFRSNLDNAELRRADFRDACLEDASLCEANLYETDLRDASLYKTDFTGANLNSARLAGSDARGVDLRRANLTDVDLSRVNLDGASLQKANLDAVCLRGANMRNIQLGGTTLVQACLEDVTGIGTWRHHGPSYLDWDTLDSAELYPGALYRECGWSDWEIAIARLRHAGLRNHPHADLVKEALLKRAAQPIQIRPILICYDFEDRKFAEACGFWFRRRGVRIRSAQCPWCESPLNFIAGKIPSDGVTLLVLSRHLSSQRSSDQDTSDPECREHTGLRLCPVALDDSWQVLEGMRSLREVLGTIPVPDLSDWRDSMAFDVELSSLSEYLGVYFP